SESKFERRRLAHWEGDIPGWRAHPGEWDSGQWSGQLHYLATDRRQSQDSSQVFRRWHVQSASGEVDRAEGGAVGSQPPGLGHGLWFDSLIYQPCQLYPRRLLSAPGPEIFSDNCRKQAFTPVIGPNDWRKPSWRASGPSLDREDGENSRP